MSNHYCDDAERVVVGMISGTSADGVDVARVSFPPVSLPRPLQVLSFATVPYPDELKHDVLEAAADNLTLRQTAVLHTRLGEFFAQVAVDSIGGGECHLVASHGQTVCHLPEFQTTLQLGEASIIANRTGRLTVSDFRTADMALGGQGAPLVPLFDAYLLASPHLTRIAVNLGGIANVTVIPPEGTLSAWDTGPANCVSDALCRLEGMGEFDPSGDQARAEKVDEKLLAEHLSMGYFRKAAPKSTGLEDFGRQFAQDFGPNLAFPDRLRTALALSAQSLADAILSVLTKENAFEVVFAGGGTSNATLMEEIETRLLRSAQRAGCQPPKFCRFSEFGVSEDAREAVAFAFLGDRTLRGLVGSEPSTTGARRAAILGKVSFPSP